MIELAGRAVVSDYMLERSMDAKDLERYVQENLSRSFAKRLSESKEFQKNIVTRERNLESRAMGIFASETVYESRMVLITPEEAKEYEMLKHFRAQLKHFTR